MRVRGAHHDGMDLARQIFIAGVAAGAADEP